MSSQANPFLISLSEEEARTLDSILAQGVKLDKVIETALKTLLLIERGFREGTPLVIRYYDAEAVVTFKKHTHRDEEADEILC